jgi:hypothetical protein
MGKTSKINTLERRPPRYTPPARAAQGTPRRKQEWVGSRAGQKSRAPAYPLPPGCAPAHLVAAAAGGRIVVANQIARGEREVWWQNLDTGEWHKCSDKRGHDPHYFRTPGADSVFETGLWSRGREMEGTHENPKWPSPTYEDVRVCVSLIASDPRELAKPVKPAAKRTKLKKKSKQKTREPVLPPPPPPPLVKVKIKRKRGRKPYGIWSAMYDHLDSVVQTTDKKFPSFLNAAEVAHAWLTSEQSSRYRQGKGTAVPEIPTIREKIADERPDLVAE